MLYVKFYASLLELVVCVRLHHIGVSTATVASAVMPGSALGSDLLAVALAHTLALVLDPRLDPAAAPWLWLGFSPLAFGLWFGFSLALAQCPGLAWGLGLSPGLALTAALASRAQP